MDYAYKLHSSAEEEYIEAYLWYEQQQDGLGERFANAVRNRLNDIVTNPEYFGKKKEPFHEVLLNKDFPFVIIYTVDKKNRLLIITSIFHTKRHPKKKYRK